MERALICRAVILSIPNKRKNTVKSTLPLSARQGALGGVANRYWGPVHSRGVLSVLLCRDTLLECFLSERVEALPLYLRSHRELLVQFGRDSKIELA